MEEKKSLKGSEKIAYGLGAVGKDMVYMLSASYVLYYFQDIMGVNTIAMGIILLIARVFDAFNDPIMGIVVAKTKTRWGKFRPWLMIGTITNAVLLVLMFSAPPALNGSGLIAYAAVTYILWGVTYTMMDIPYWSMIPAFTSSGKEREGLSALARSCAGVGSAIVTIGTVMIVSLLGGKVDARRSENITQAFTQADKAITYYIVERDEDGNPTSEHITADGASVSVELVGVERAFETNVDEKSGDEYISFTDGNTEYTLSIAGAEYNSDDGEVNVELSMDSIDADKAILAVYLNPDIYEKVSSSGDYTTALNMHSTIEVERLGFRGVAIIIGLLFIIFICITCFKIKEKSSVDMQTAGVGEMFKALVKNDQAVAVVITIVLINTALYITSNLLIYFFKYDLGGTNWQGDYTTFNAFSGAVQILAMMAFPLLRKAFTTMKIFKLCVWAEIIGYITLLGMTLVGVTSVFAFFVPGFLIMASVGVLNVVVTVFLANTVDYGEYKNHRRDESVIFSMQTFVVKLASGIAALIASITLSIFSITDDGALSYAGLAEKINNLGVVDTMGGGSLIGLRMEMTLGPILLLVVAMLVFRIRYILTDEKLAEIDKELHHV